MRSKEKQKEYNKLYYLRRREELLHRSREWRRNNRIRHRAYTKMWAKENKEKHNETNRKNRHKYYSPEKTRDRWLQWKYAITSEQYADLLTYQKNRCAVCGSAEPRTKNGWCVDHNHDTGIVRGVLCNPCNVILGFHEKYGIPVAGGFLRYLESPPFLKLNRPTVKLAVVGGGK